MVKISKPISNLFEGLNSIVNAFYYAIADAISKEIQNIIFPSLKGL